MGFIRNVINFLERFDKSAAIEPKPIEKAVKAKPSQPKPINPKQDSLSRKAEAAITDAINVLFSDGAWFKTADIVAASDYSNATVAVAIKRLVQNGTLEAKGKKFDPSRAYRLSVKPAPIVAVVATKKCHKCGEDKPHSEFSKNRTQKDGLHCWCKSCHSQYDKAKRAEKRAKKASLKYTVDKFGNVVDLNKVAN